MRKLLAAGVAAGIAILLAFPAWAGTGPPSTSSGTGQVLATVISTRTADGNAVFDLSVTGFTNGTFTGPFTERVRQIVHPDGSTTAEGTGTQTLIAGPCGPGSFDFQVEAQGTFPPLKISGSFRSIDEAADTVTIHTVNTFVAIGGTFTYSGSFTCG